MKYISLPRLPWRTMCSPGMNECIWRRWITSPTKSGSMVLKNSFFSTMLLCIVISTSVRRLLVSPFSTSSASKKRRRSCRWS